MDFFDTKLIESIDIDEITKEKSFPWLLIQGVLKSEAFDALYRDFPSLELFHYHQDVFRHTTQQRPHNRYYASFMMTPYKELAEKTGKGIIYPQDLEKSWQDFLREVGSNHVYNKFVSNLLGSNLYGISVAWHVGITGNDVSPHTDSTHKLGTHLFYFNTSNDWDPDWGGDFLTLEDCQKNIKNPEVKDFNKVTKIPITDNRSLIFRNTPNAWHGVKPLQCPEGKHRRLVNIIFNKMRE